MHYFLIKKKYHAERVSIEWTSIYCDISLDHWCHGLLLCFAIQARCLTHWYKVMITNILNALWNDAVSFQIELNFPIKTQSSIITDYNINKRRQKNITSY